MTQDSKPVTFEDLVYSEIIETEETREFFPRNALSSFWPCRKGSGTEAHWRLLESTLAP